MIEDEVNEARIEMGLSFALLCEALNNDDQYVNQLCGAAKPTPDLLANVQALLHQYHRYRADVLARIDQEGGTIGTIELVRALMADAFSFSKLVSRNHEAIRPSGQRPRPEGKRNIENYYTRGEVERLFDYNEVTLKDVTDNRRVGPVARWFLAWLRQQALVTA